MQCTFRATSGRVLYYFHGDFVTEINRSILINFSTLEATSKKNYTIISSFQNNIPFSPITKQIISLFRRATVDQRSTELRIVPLSYVSIHQNLDESRSIALPSLLEANALSYLLPLPITAVIFSPTLETSRSNKNKKKKKRKEKRRAEQVSTESVVRAAGYRVLFRDPLCSYMRMPLMTRLIGLKRRNVLHKNVNFGISRDFFSFFFFFFSLHARQTISWTEFNLVCFRAKDLSRELSKGQPAAIVAANLTAIPIHVSLRVDRRSARKRSSLRVCRALNHRRAAFKDLLVEQFLGERLKACRH